MILTKPLLKKWLKEYEGRPKSEKSERDLQREIKCQALRYEVYRDKECLEEIFIALLDLCYLKSSSN